MVIRSGKIMKSTRGRRNNKVNKSNVCSLPNELLTEIVARVASKSFKTYINAKLSCKVFNEIANERYVYRNTSLAEFPIEPAWEKQKQEKINKLTSFMELCRECGNTEALYRKGVMDFFKYNNPELALEFLKAAAKGGHIGALYVIGIILVFLGGDYKQKGVNLIGYMKETRQLRSLTRQCRNNLRHILTNIWVNNPLILEERPTCCTMQHRRTHRNRWCSWPDLDSEDEDEFQCHACNCDVEIAQVIRVLPKY